MVRALIQFVVPAINFMLLVAVGLDLSPADFARVRQRPLLVLSGVFAPILVLPPVVLALTALFHTSPEVSAGLLLVAACPIGGISNAYSYLARASPALSVTLTGLSCLFASLTIPAVGHALELASGRPLDLTPPLPVLFVQLLLLLAVPVALGMWIKRRLPDLAVRYRPVLQQASFISIAVVLALIIADAPGAFLSGLLTTILPAAVFVIVSMAAGWIVGALITDDPRDCFTMAAEFGTRNITVAMAIAVTLLGRVDFARFATAYALTEVPLMVIAIALFRYHSARSSIRSATLPA
jgi:BASS family bile acid:Na+ symporter